MPGIDRRAASVTWTVALIVLLLWLLYQVRSTLFLFVLALFFAFMLAPLVDWVNRMLPGKRRWRQAGLVISYVLLVAAVAGAGAAIVTKVVEQATAFENGGLARRLPELVSTWIQRIPVEQLRAEIVQRSGEWASSLPKAALRFLSMASGLIYIVIVPILAFFFLKDGAIIRQQILELAEAGPQRSVLDAVLTDAHLLLAQYIRALVALSLVAFVTQAFFFAVVGMPYSVLLAALAGMLEFIPTIGPLTAALVILAVTWVSGGPLLLVAGFLAAFRMFQDYVLSPKLLAEGMEMHPLLVLFGVFAGMELAGIPGAFLSVPVLALGRLVVRRLRKS
ncbi:MAG: AI-2E family transporter [Bryobacteraceae bacterium]|jgi:predicted PurR-regulated permease PerM